MTCDQTLCLTFEEFMVTQNDSVLIPSYMAGDILVTIDAWSKGGIMQDAGLFNTGDPHPGCQDLGSPNTLYGGPGENANHPDGYAPSNNKHVGNVVVVQNPNVDFPDDYFLSDSLVYTFSEPVFIESLDALDFEEEQALSGAGVYLYDADGNEISFTGFSPLLGNDNSLEELELKTGGVKKLKVYFGSAVPGSGGIGALCFVHEPCVAEDVIASDNCNDMTLFCEDVTNVIDACTTEIIHTYIAEDICGNVSSCTQVITLTTDGMQPDIICPDDITIGCDDPVPAPDPDAVVVTDDCTAEGDIFVTWVEDIVDGTGCDEVIRRIYQALDFCGNEALCVQFITREAMPPQVQITAQLFLQAAMNEAGDSMDAVLNGMGYLPDDQPYTMAPFDYWGDEVCDSLPEDIVDWVLVQLRDVVTMEVIASRAALVKENGDIVDMDGVSPVLFDAPGDWYYIEVCHRNHLAIITTVAMDCTDGDGECDFRQDLTDTQGMVEVSLGMWAMQRGDVNGDHQIKYNGSNNDRVAILNFVGITTPNNIVPGYSRYDVNMDGSVKYNGANNDKNAILSEVGLTSPNTIIVGQMYE
jgi:hypothetical protein